MRALTLLMMLLHLAMAHAQERLVINTGFTSPVSDLFGELVTEAGRRLDLSILFQEVSAERALKLVQQGIDDGECCRIPRQIMVDYPELLSVPVPIYKARFVAFSREPKLKIQKWEDLRSYHVGSVTGWKILVDNINRVQPHAHWVVDDPESMFRMLYMGRIDVATLGLVSGLDQIRRLGMQKWISPLLPPLAEENLYLQLHPRHKALVDDFSRVFTEMEADLTTQTITNRFIKGM